MSKTRGSNKQPGRRKCDPHNSRNFRKGLNLLQFINRSKVITPTQKGALAYLGERMNREER